MTPEERARALSVARRYAGAAGAPRETPRPAVAAADFSDLPLNKKLQTMRGFSKSLGLSDPFFRSHDARAGSTSVMGGREVLNFASYDYLGLNGHEAVTRAAIEAVARYGVSASASRLVAGERPIHRALESALAAFHGLDAAVTFVSGHGANVSTIATLVGAKDLLLVDSLAHNSLVCGAQLSAAARRTFAHNDLDQLEQMLSASRGDFENALIVVEGLYSMDGDFPDLARLLEIKERHGAWLMVDEAHSVGVLGATGRGLAEHAGVDPRRIDVTMGTLGKSLAACGGYIAGSQALIDLLKYHAPGFVYSVGLPPVIAAAALAALEILIAEPSRVDACRAAGRRFLETARDAGFDTGTSSGAAVTPVMTGASLKAVAWSQALLAKGINALPIIHPAVPENAARLRFFLTAAHAPAQIEETIAVLKSIAAAGDAPSTAGKSEA